MQKIFTGFDSVLGSSKEVQLSLMERGLEVKYLELDMTFFVAYSNIAEFTCRFGSNDSKSHIRVIAKSGSVICDVNFALPDPNDSVKQIKSILEHRIG